MRRIEFAEGETVFSEGEPSTYCYQIVRGRVEIRLGATGDGEGQRGESVGSYGPGEIFGEMSIIDPGPRSAGAVASEPTVCVAYTGDEMMSLLETDPQEALNYIRALIRRIRDTNRRVLRAAARG